jgi:hypothetical protein
MLLKPLLPVLSDTAAHIFLYSEHVATVHFENGKYHVHKEMNEAAKKNLPEQNQQDQKKVISPDEYLVTIVPCDLPHSVIIKKQYLSLSYFIKSHIAAGDTPPPKV